MSSSQTDGIKGPKPNPGHPQVLRPYKKHLFNYQSKQIVQLFHLKVPLQYSFYFFLLSQLAKLKFRALIKKPGKTAPTRGFTGG
jgi:hypothetical protein